MAFLGKTIKLFPIAFKIKETEQWQYIRYTQKMGDTIWQDSPGNLFYGTQSQEISNSELLQAE